MHTFNILVTIFAFLFVTIFASVVTLAIRFSQKKSGIISSLVWLLSTMLTVCIMHLHHNPDGAEIFGILAIIEMIVCVILGVLLKGRSLTP